MNRLGIEYICISPDIDESSRGETHADDLAKRLAFTKAQVIAQKNPEAIVIDQIRLHGENMHLMILLANH